MSRSPEHDGVVYHRKETRVWWIRYRDRNGIRRRESAQTEDWDEAKKDSEIGFKPETTTSFTL